MSKRILEFFDTPDPVSDPLTRKLTSEDLLVASLAGVALEKFIEDKNSTVSPIIMNQLPARKCVSWSPISLSATRF